MPEQPKEPRRRVLEPTGGYQGGLPASEVGPPPRTPSGTADVPVGRKKRAK